ncbi:hypothetical protein PIROE2DRAFT_17860 [Piromyces sp. E2]|nr:hypothetical protein PIROE2DRAFT_17860 [Piromyces sp. E2]|eukprot:OUM57213.1 hypothetical protein PIROE2DRAFT_17860 [Piromyces sp. E2]
MSEAAKTLSQKRYNEVKRTVIVDAVDLVLNTIASQTSLKEKNKTFTNRKLTNTIELLYKLLGDLHNDQFPSEIMNSLKPHVTTQLSNTFCYKTPIKNNSTKDILEDIPIIFSPFIKSAVEVSYKEIKKDFKLQKLPEHYRFFALNLNVNNNEYIITYAEENKYSKREIIEVLEKNVEINKDNLSQEIKTQYGFI